MKVIIGELDLYIILFEVMRLIDVIKLFKDVVLLWYVYRWVWCNLIGVDNEWL